jgi:K+-sensing histidine kinase KdpD
VGRLVYFSAAALVIVGAIQLAASASGRAGELPSLALIFLAALPCVGLIEGLRRGVLDLLESVLAPRLRELRRLRESFGTHLARLGDEDAIAEHLLAAARAALSPRAGCVFLAEGGEWRPCLPFGANPATRVSVAEEAEQLLGGRSVVHLELEEPRSRAAALKDRGIEVVASIASGGERFGVLTLGSSDRGAPYTGLELEFVAMAASQVGSALRSARLTRRLLEVERAATRERVAVALAHDLGKDLDWLTRLARRLPSRLTDPKRLARDAALIREFADGLRDGLQDFVRNLGEPAAERRGLLELGDLVEDAIARVSRLHGPQRVTARVDPSCRHLSVHPNLRHVVTSLLDNALHASAESEPVQVVTMLEGSELVIQVADAGAGIPEKLREEVFRAGFTTRAAGGGLGVGLTVCRELVEAAGGSLRLVPNRGGGTRAIARVPRPGAETGPNTPCADA